MSDILIRTTEPLHLHALAIRCAPAFADWYGQIARYTIVGPRFEIPCQLEIDREHGLTANADLSDLILHTRDAVETNTSAFMVSQLGIWKAPKNHLCFRLLPRMRCLRCRAAKQTVAENDSSSGCCLLLHSFPSSNTVDILEPHTVS
jgi:hypothetical protein